MFKKILIKSFFALLILTTLTVACLSSCEKEITYLVKFDTGCDISINTEEVAKGNKATEPDAITREGYNFDGWYLGNKLWDFGKDTVSENITLTAKWSPVRYNADFVADGTTVQTVIFTYGDTALPFIPAVPQKNGYTGVWESYTFGMHNITVNAVYTPIVYSITYENLKGCTHTNPTTYTAESDTIVLSELYRDESIFAGWYDQNNNRVTSIAKGSYGNLILTVHWTDKYTVSFDSKGGSNISAQLVAPGGSVMLPAQPTRAHYSFDGWYYGNELWDFNNDTITENVTLIAKWTPVQYNAKFYADGELVATVKFTVEDTEIAEPSVPQKNGYRGEWKSFILSPQDLDINAMYTIIEYTITYNNLNGAVHSNPIQYTINSDTIILSELTSETSVFEGWFDETGTAITAIPKGSYGNKSLTAKWVGKCNVIFNSDGGSNVASQLVAPGEKAIMPQPPTKAGYEFGGWYVDDVLWDFEENVITEDNITLKAKWTLIQYDAIFYADGRVIGTVRYTVEDSVLSQPPAIPSKIGYDCKWEHYDLQIGGITVNAEYSLITYTITYKGLDRTTHTNPTDYNIETPTITLTSPTKRDGYTFAGWFDSSDNLITSIEKGTHGDIILTAKWSPIVYYASFYADGVLISTVPFTVEDSKLSAIPEIPYKNGYTSNWSSYKIVAENITVNAVYTPVAPTTYTITYTNIREGINYNPAQYTNASDDIILIDLYGVSGFLCWYDEAGNKITTIPKGTTGDLVLTAKWEITYAEYLALSTAEKTKYYHSFDTVDDYFTWMNAAKAKYEEEQDRVIIDSDKPIEIN